MVTRFLSDRTKDARAILMQNTPASIIYDVYDNGNFVEFTTNVGTYRVYADGKITER